MSIQYNITNLLCQGHLPDASHDSGEGGPGDRLQPSSLQPFLENGKIYQAGIALMFGLEGSSSSSAVVPEEEGSQHCVADAELSGDVYGRGLGRKAYQEG